MPFVFEFPTAFKFLGGLLKQPSLSKTPPRGRLVQSSQRTTVQRAATTLAIGLDFLSGHRGMVRIADREPPLSGGPTQGGMLVTSLRGISGRPGRGIW